MCSRKSIDHATYWIYVSNIAVWGSAMAKLSNLIEVFADTLSVPPTTVEAYVKALRKQGLLTTGGRGRGAPNITADDCAKVLVAMMAGSPTHAVEKLYEFGELRSFGCDRKPGELSKPMIDALKLQPGHSFIEGVAALISHSIDQNPADIARDTIRSFFIPPEGSIHEFSSGSVGIRYPGKEATIKFFLQYDAPIGENIYKSNIQEAFIMYMPEEYWRTFEIDTPYMTIEVLVRLYAIDEIGAMLSR